MLSITYHRHPEGIDGRNQHNSGLAEPLHIAVGYGMIVYNTALWNKEHIEMPSFDWELLQLKYGPKLKGLARENKKMLLAQEIIFQL